MHALAGKRIEQRPSKKGLTNLCLYEIMAAGFDSELAGAVRSAEGRRRKAESRRRSAGKPAVQENGDQIGFFSPLFSL